MDQKIVQEAIKMACKRAGTQTKLAKTTGITQGRISDYLSGRRVINNMTLATFFDLFPSMEIDFFGDNSMSSVTSGFSNNVINGPTTAAIHIVSGNNSGNNSENRWGNQQLGKETVRPDVEGLILAHDDWDPSLRIELLRNFFALEIDDFKTFVIEKKNLDDTMRLEILKTIRSERR